MLIFVDSVVMVLGCETVVDGGVVLVWWGPKRICSPTTAAIPSRDV